MRRQVAPRWHTAGAIRLACAAIAMAHGAWLPPAAIAQVQQRGFAEVVLTGFPQEAVNDPVQAVGEALLRYEAGVRLGDWRLDGSIDARYDTHDMTAWDEGFGYWDRTIERPFVAVRRASVSWAHGPYTIEAGKQFVRWGKTDVLTPTDRFAPRDYLGGISSDVLAVTALRAVVAGNSDSLEAVVTPRMTPSRMPLIDQRWIVLPGGAEGLAITDAGARYPTGTQAGLRWNHVGRHLEHSLSVFRGFDHLPMVVAAPLASTPAVAVRREYGKMHAFGADVAVPLPWFTVKAEAAWLGSDTRASQELALYVVQAERQVGEWLFIVGYAGEYVAREARTFRYSPDRGLAKAIVGRASLTIDTNRSLAVETVVRQNGDGVYGRFEYAQAVGPHWRLIGQVTLLGGNDDDYLGQYRRNSHGALTARFSF